MKLLNRHVFKKERGGNIYPINGRILFSPSDHWKLNEIEVTIILIHVAKRKVQLIVMQCDT